MEKCVSSKYPWWSRSSSRTVLCLLLLGGFMPLTGCIIIDCDECGTVWTKTEEETISFAPVGSKQIEIRTHNGSIEFEPLSAGETQSTVKVKKRTRGLSPSDAQQAMDALRVFARPRSDGTLEIGTEWAEPKKRRWGAEVSFDVHAPAAIPLDAQTHNGMMVIRGLEADARIVTHNGTIDVQSSGTKLEATTHNGKIVAEFSGGDVALLTHNGRIESVLTGTGPISGEIETHNGAVAVTLASKASTELRAETHAGSIDCDVPLADQHVSRREVSGVIGAGGGRLAVTTHNGGIKIRGDRG